MCDSWRKEKEVAGENRRKIPRTIIQEREKLILRRLTAEKGEGET